MLIEAKTLKHALEDMVTQHGIVEILDRLACISHSSKASNASQMTKLLEDAVQFALAQESQAQTTIESRKHA